MTSAPNAVVTRDPGAIAESVIAKGDLAKLTPQERTQYYTAVCESVGLNPLTQPLAYITLNGKLTLYALRGATDQLRKVHNVSVVEMTETERDGVYIVTAKVRDATGRTDIAKGAVTIGGLKGDALANSIMKAETKAKRRATLSIVGLGMLDETEIETIPDAKPANRVRDGSDGQPKSSRQAKIAGDWEITKELDAITTAAELVAWRETNAAKIEKFNGTWLASFEEMYDAKTAELQKPSDADSAVLLKSLAAMLDRCETQPAVKEWIHDKDTKISIRLLTEDDYLRFEDAYQARMDAVPNILAAG